MPMKMNAEGPFLAANEQQLGGVVRANFAGLGDRLVRALKSGAPTDRGDFKRSIKRRISGQGLTAVLAIYADSKDAQFVEEGRKPGKAPPLRSTGRMITRGKNKGKQQKESIIVDWLKRRGFTNAKLRGGIAYRIGQKIAREGVKGWHGFSNLTTDHAGEINQATNTLSQQLARRLSGGR